MIEEMKKAIEMDQRKQEEFKKRFQDPKTSPTDLGYSYIVLGEDRLDEIEALYKSYQGKKEFLYCPDRKELQEAVSSDGVCYLGMETAMGTLVGVIKVKEIKEFPDSFFIPPQYDQGEDKKFYGMSGLMVNNDFRKRGLAKHLTHTTLRVLHRMGATGVYADCDYRNKASFATISSVMDFVGFTDGRFGAEGERTIYTMFYSSIDKDQNPQVSELVLDFSKARNLGEVAQTISSTIDNFGGADKTKVAYGEPGEYNTLHVLHNRVRTAGKTPTLVLADEHQMTAQNDNEWEKRNAFLAQLPSALISNKQGRN